MAEPTDLIMPILQRIQADISDIKSTLDDQGRRLGEMNGYLSLSLNTQMRHTDDIDTLRAELKAIKQRVAALEARSH